MSHYVIEDPLTDYAAAFMRKVHERFGYTPICLFTNPKWRYFHERRFPVLAELAPDTRFNISVEDLPDAAAKIRAQYKGIVGIVPFAEESLDHAPHLIELFGLDWNAPEVLARFRDKNAFKAHVARARPSLRLNLHFLVRGPADLDVELPERFVLKPNDGGGSAGVGVFTRGTPKSDLARFLAARPGQVFILEEFVDGTLYAVDGLVDERGAVHVASVFTSGRVSANGSDVVYADGWLIRQNTSLFRDLTGYAAEVMAAGGLRRCPFHMEVIVDSRGPCLIEVGARLIGHRHAYTCSLTHRNRFDFIAASAHGYLSPKPYGDLGFDWDYYNSIQAMKIYGVSRKAGLVGRVGGVEAVERMPEFVHWIVKPGAGQSLVPTTDLVTVPYSLILVGKGTLEALRAAADTVHRTLVFDVDGPMLVQLWFRFVNAFNRARLNLGWIFIKRSS